MRLSAITAASTLLSMSSAVTISKRQAVHDTIFNAVLDWQANTGNVSAFLDQAAVVTQATGFGDIDLTGLATTALGHEQDELNQKSALEGQLCTDSTCNDNANANANLKGAKDTLEQGSFANVVNLLTALSRTDGTDVGAAGGDIININLGSQGRCQAVLPAIDQYFIEAGNFLLNQFGDSSLLDVRAIRPQACNDSL